MFWRLSTSKPSSWRKRFLPSVSPALSPLHMHVSSRNGPVTEEGEPAQGDGARPARYNLLIMH